RLRTELTTTLPEDAVGIRAGVRWRRSKIRASGARLGVAKSSWDWICGKQGKSDGCPPAEHRVPEPTFPFLERPPPPRGFRAYRKSLAASSPSRRNVRR